MTPGEMLATLDDAIAYAPPWWEGGPALELTTPVVLGVRGHPVAPDPATGRMQYGYSKRACKRIRRVILAAARDVAAGH